MRNVKLDNSDLLAYFDTVQKLKKQPSMDEYRKEYFRLREDDSVPQYKLREYYSAHTELRRLDRKRKSLMDFFIEELNPISFSTANTSAKSSGDLDKFYESRLYGKAIVEKSDEEIVSLIIKQRTEAALEFQRSVEQSLEQLSSISSDLGTLNTKRRKMAI
ncbi:DUF4756 family protein [Pectobacterium parmentieri]|uniref:DUF4756 domain-containing protein n=1 Tax=Pectobacterium parmentieri TaxID=1905730 RepID=A0A8B3FBX3_PECPM|nr:DUF4756 family protein [Pectobacterium parmentieri]AOR59259.1 DUF4756 domain-containing protein [Pectobacterium parmentieri]AYH09726.1 DUF4756 domain-containing protein [Pectobacterium parmentieri]AYH19565.1 DUF4756 domain-containing protein [Pectobacterium parmentieri]AYH36046.1 DUF4756 domain-containing protein [Pectobacterium parmentieri]AZS56150.1 DUF4756 domain-containing protein [Pectobacterium parmentieri]